MFGLLKRDIEIFPVSNIKSNQIFCTCRLYTRIATLCRDKYMLTLIISPCFILSLHISCILLLRYPVENAVIVTYWLVWFGVHTPVCEAERSEAGLGGGGCCSCCPSPLSPRLLQLLIKQVFSTPPFCYYHMLCLFFFDKLISTCPSSTLFFSWFFFSFPLSPLFDRLYFSFCFISLLHNIFLWFCLVVVVSVMWWLLWCQQNWTSLLVLTYFHSSRERKRRRGKTRTK